MTVTTTSPSSTVSSDSDSLNLLQDLKGLALSPLSPSGLKAVGNIDSNAAGAVGLGGVKSTIDTAESDVSKSASILKVLGDLDTWKALGMLLAGFVLLYFGLRQLAGAASGA